MTTIKTISMAVLVFGAFGLRADGQIVPPAGGVKVDSVPPVIADIETENVMRLISGNTLTRKVAGRFYRDDRMRTRLEMGTQVMISDPVAQITISMDTAKRQARVTDVSSRPFSRAAVEGQPATPNPPASGARIIEGFPTIERESTSVRPAGSEAGNSLPLKRVTKAWYSKDLLLPLLTVAEDDVAGITTTRYQNLKVGTNPSPDLFQVPDGFWVTRSVRPADRPASSGFAGNPLTGK